MLSTVEAAKLLGVSSIRVRNLIYDGALPAQKVGRSWVLREEDVMARLARQPAPAGFARTGGHRVLCARV